MDNNDNTVFVNFDKQNKQGELEELYKELGKAYYKGAFEDPLPELLPLFDRITVLVKSEELPVIQPGQEPGYMCPICSGPLQGNEGFCDKCGTRLGQPEISPQEAIFCMNCGTKLRRNAVFCGECGSIVG